ncbi:DUF3892 domain-containing protein [Salinibacterium sp. NSLL150]|uniref:DUF3892 domain-containing protein n=1 Tax=unclassified Salinibacterium TaxID=2632331 RepID=UPI0018CE4310|nr:MULTISPECIES: DUF3892 domain-containing protein [unclassified Salinibacterium]MBH0098018.1 DUF3892 domain-containing protein [Salinibacterium sp. NSLL35]MBH0100773.1 DUF3892 domain-containing protein [Salinibacterium sp. NSLL150]MBH0103532.1 DUF3892 domain-containing protein [Salinibacterium sp. NSLL16]MBH0106293.1 DUF3892 domain-containing protein [Salinibacterium sp. NSLL17]
MSVRPVRQSRKDNYGNITALGDEGAVWSPRSSADVIFDIERGTHSYYVPWESGHTPIRVVPGQGGKYLRTDRDATARNNLDELPDC